MIHNFCSHCCYSITTYKFFLFNRSSEIYKKISLFFIWLFLHWARSRKKKEKNWAVIYFTKLRVEAICDFDAEQPKKKTIFYFVIYSRKQKKIDVVF